MPARASDRVSPLPRTRRRGPIALLFILPLLAGCSAAPPGTAAPSTATPAASAAASLGTDRPSPAGEPTATPLPTARTYTVEAGDTLSGIAERFGLVAEELLLWNPQVTDANRIREGDVLTIPAAGATPPPPSLAPGQTLSPLASWNEWESQEALFRVRLPPDWFAVTWEAAHDADALRRVVLRYPRSRDQIETHADRMRSTDSPQSIAGLTGGAPETATPRVFVEITYLLGAVSEGVAVETVAEEDAAAITADGGEHSVERRQVGGRDVVVLSVSGGSDSTGERTVIGYYLTEGEDVYRLLFTVQAPEADPALLDQIVATFEAAPVPG